MSIIKVRTNTFIGYRVRRLVNGKIMERRFSIRVPYSRTGELLSKRQAAVVYRAAEKFDLLLAKKQETARRKREKMLTPSRRNSTGVRGINHGWIYDRSKAGELYKWPAFVVQCVDTDGRKLKRCLSINAYGYAEAWKKAVAVLVDAKGLGRAMRTALSEALPPKPRRRSSAI